MYVEIDVMETIAIVFLKNGAGNKKPWNNKKYVNIHKFPIVQLENTVDDQTRPWLCGIYWSKSDK